MLDMSASVRLPGSSMRAGSGHEARGPNGWRNPRCRSRPDLCRRAVLAAMAFSQLKAVRADVSAAREEIMLAQEHATRLERRLEKALQDFDQRQAKASEQAQNNAAQNQYGAKQCGQGKSRRAAVVPAHARRDATHSKLHQGLARHLGGGRYNQRWRRASRYDIAASAVPDRHEVSETGGRPIQDRSQRRHCHLTSKKPTGRRGYSAQLDGRVKPSRPRRAPAGFIRAADDPLVQLYER